MSERYEEGTTVEVSFTVRLPVSATYDEIKTWVMFEVGALGSIATANPLHDDLEAVRGSVRISPRGSPTPSAPHALGRT